MRALPMIWKRTRTRQLKPALAGEDRLKKNIVHRLHVYIPFNRGYSTAMIREAATYQNRMVNPGALDCSEKHRGGFHNGGTGTSTPSRTP